MVTIDAQIINAIIISIIGGVGGILGALAMRIRYNSQANSHAVTTRADGDLIAEKSRAGVLADISEIAKTGVQTQKEVIAVVRENTNAFNENAAEMRGMVAMSKELTQALRNATVGMDETHVNITAIKTDMTTTAGVLKSLPTELESINTQFGPVVDELKGIGIRIAQTNDRLTELFTEFRGAERRVLAILEPYALAQAEKIRSQTLTATTTVEETLTATVTEEIPQS